MQVKLVLHSTPVAQYLWLTDYYEKQQENPKDVDRLVVLEGQRESSICPINNEVFQDCQIIQDRINKKLGELGSNGLKLGSSE